MILFSIGMILPHQASQLPEEIQFSKVLQFSDAQTLRRFCNTCKAFKGEFNDLLTERAYVEILENNQYRAVVEDASLRSPVANIDRDHARIFLGLLLLRNVFRLELFPSFVRILEASFIRTPDVSSILSNLNRVQMDRFGSHCMITGIVGVCSKACIAWFNT
jgi:hypothetical protein